MIRSVVDDQSAFKPFCEVLKKCTLIRFDLFPLFPLFPPKITYLIKKTWLASSLSEGGRLSCANALAKDSEKGPSRKYINVSLGFLIVEKKGEARGKSRRTV